MGFDDYKVVLYRNQPNGWVAEIPAIRGCYALMPTREEALAELIDERQRLLSELPLDPSHQLDQVRQEHLHAERDLLELYQGDGP